MDPQTIEIIYAKDKQVILKGDLFQNIRPEESVWQIEDKTKLLLFLTLNPPGYFNDYKKYKCFSDIIFLEISESWES